VEALRPDGRTGGAQERVTATGDHEPAVTALRIVSIIR
jgi:hypothetical protein